MKPLISDDGAVSPVGAIFATKSMKKFTIHDALLYTQTLINTLHDPVILLHEDLKVALANRSFYHAFEVESEETEGKFIYDLGNRQWDIPKLRQLLEEILPKTTSLDGFEVEHNFSHIGKKVMLLNARRIYLQIHRMKLIIITFKDITEHKKIANLHEEIKKLKAQLRKTRLSK